MENLKEIREEIDAIDTQIIKLVSKRRELVLSAAPYKDSIEGPTGVRVPERISSMLLSLREQATSHKLDPDFIEQWFTELIEHSIGLELEEWKSLDRQR